MPKGSHFLIAAVSYVLLILMTGACESSPSKKPKTPTLLITDSVQGSPNTYIHTHYLANSGTKFQKTDIARLKAKVASLCRHYLDQDSVSGIAVQYLDLRSGEGFTLFPNKRFIPASLLKLPVLIAVFKLEEEQPGSLNSKPPVYEVINDDIDKNLEENETFSFRGDYSYTLKELAQIMISHSDNRATVSVMEFLNKKSPGIIERVEADLQASIPMGVDNRAEIVYIGHFATMINALYSCSYLNEAHSNAALEILNSSRYQRGFRKSIPSQIAIAHKFGVRFDVTELNPEFPVQLHEVAIIYHPSNPFILSVMTKGTHVEALRSALREIASTCYTDIDYLSKKE